MVANASAVSGGPGYRVIVPAETLARAGEVARQLHSGEAKPGGRLRARLEELGSGVAGLGGKGEPGGLGGQGGQAGLDLLGLLMDTKPPQIFAESAVVGDGWDWTLAELGLLGDISVAAPVTVFDDGNHTAPTPHAEPFDGVLVFTPGALLCNGRGHTPADWQEVTDAGGGLSPAGFASLYRRRLLPVLRFINQHAGRARSAVVTVPGLGCGQFAGPFRGRLGTHLQTVLHELLSEHGPSLGNLRAVYFDPYQECGNARSEIHGISLMVRPLTAAGNGRKSQLCRPAAYAEAGDDFSGCSLYSLVAWDHVSWPGNDFYVGSRCTDDGVKAAATSAMATLTGVAGRYDPGRGMYLPPSPYRQWAEVVQEGVRSGGLRLWHPGAVWLGQEGGGS